MRNQFWRTRITETAQELKTARTFRDHLLEQDRDLRRALGNLLEESKEFEGIVVDPEAPHPGAALQEKIEDVRSEINRLTPSIAMWEEQVARAFLSVDHVLREGARHGMRVPAGIPKSVSGEGIRQARELIERAEKARVQHAS